ncbi:MULTISPECIES: GntR family transcriptional regulator [unclassified Streptomyces]|uniref:GntR family transcriptional regulator n=1 Tax=unclassified Streptomyces TaxID=2593676 RepID=UPI001D758B89|nr:MULTISPECIES: GntR family transcriptional regulator [unclassified Streptomyces]MBD0709506.1 GntR family transcriptional regulator [Streptomyces sp. CBMA291]MBD0713216.1 GntR family transcriptional regulator [Streptomyces sp. CBMA370]
MEQGAARERATDRPSPPFGNPVRVPEQARTTPQRPAEPERNPGAGATAFPASPPVPPSAPAPASASPGSARGDRTHGEPAAGRAEAGPVSVPGPRVVRHSVRVQVLAALRAALVDGDLVPGEVYSAPALGERLGVSATPVREAMQRLAVEGAVEVVPNRGFRVTERTPRELAELAEVRALIEVPVILRLAHTVPAARWAELRPLAEATATAAALGDRAHYAEADRDFHRAVLTLAGNQQLLAVADDLHRRSQWPLMNARAFRQEVLVADAAEHMALLDALTARDLDVVQSLVREHFTGSGC